MILTKNSIFLHFFSVDLQENSRLIQYYLRILKIRKEEFIKNYKPSSWELLTTEEQRALARLHAQESKNKELEDKLFVKHKLREFREDKKKKIAEILALKLKETTSKISDPLCPILDEFILTK